MILSFEIPDDRVAKAIEAFSVVYKYKETIFNPDYDIEDPESQEMIDNPENKAAFAKRHIKQYIRGVYIAGNLTIVNQAVTDAKVTLKEESEEITSS